MKQTDIPTTFPTPFAASGTKNTIPVPSQTATDPGLASFTDGFPPATFTDVAAGGVPPYGADFNGILNMLSAAIQWNDAGGCYPYDSAFSTAIGGYPKGAVVLNDSGDGFWQSTADDNTTDPASDTSGKWLPLAVPGNASIALSGSNVTLTPDQYQRRTLMLTGTLTVNVQVTLPTIANLQWQVINNTSGGYTVTVKTAAGTGVSCPQAGSTTVYCDGVNIGRLNTFATNAQSLAGSATDVVSNPAGVAAYVQQFGLGRAQQADHVTDWNSLTTKNIFCDRVMGTGNPNNPTSTGLFYPLVASYAGGSATQVAIGYRISDGNYWRNLYSGTWSAWKRIWDSNSFDPSNYALVSALSAYLTTSAAASTYLTQSNAASTYLAKSNLGSAIAAMSAGAIGTYAYLGYSVNANPGDNVAGSSLLWGSTNYYAGHPSGTWQLQGYIGGNITNTGSVWKRVA